MKNIPLFLIFILFFNKFIVAQENKSVYQNLYFGIEQDIIPFFCKGFSTGIWLGFNQFRANFNYNQNVIPGFLSVEAIKEEKVSRIQFGLDFFLNKKHKGIFLNLSLSQVNMQIETKDLFKGKIFDNYFGLGMGYNYYFFKNFYLSPRLLIHFKLIQTNNILLGSLNYNSNLILPEINLNLGYKF